MNFVFENYLYSEQESVIRGELGELEELDKQTGPTQ